jgi:hypothetical protein
MRTMDKWTIIALTLIFIGNIGGILIVIVQARNSAKDKDQIIKTTNDNNDYLKGQLEVITGEREALKADLTARDIENQKKSEEIIQLNKELLKKSEELNKFLGASDSYPILLVSSMKSDKGTPGFTFTIQNEFEYPIYDIEVNVFDFQFILDNSKHINGQFTISKENFTKSIIFQHDQTQIAPKSNVITSKVHHLPDVILYVKLKCRGSFVFEKIAFVTIGNTILHGFMVYDDKGTILKSWYGNNPTADTKKTLDDKFNLIPKSITMNFTN